MMLISDEANKRIAMMLSKELCRYERLRGRLGGFSLLWKRLPFLSSRFVRPHRSYTYTLAYYRTPACVRPRACVTFLRRQLSGRPHATVV